ncbi:MAG TPA: N-6 DNA methylase [Terriglobia bacterium]|nr:N-6 DNA methylase [Terriglobia bacterium]
MGPLTIEKEKNERVVRPATGLLEHALKLQARYGQRISVDERKRKGQYFTPPEVCSFMASLFSEPKADVYRFLDPGAGIGSLTAALCERLSQSRRLLSIEAHVFENPLEMLGYFETMSFFGVSALSAARTRPCSPSMDLAELRYQYSLRS